MEDYKLRDLRPSHTLTLVTNHLFFSTSFFLSYSFPEFAAQDRRNKDWQSNITEGRHAHAVILHTYSRVGMEVPEYACKRLIFGAFRK